MSIYKKIADIQKKLSGDKFNQSNGFHGKYIDLPTLLPPIMNECYTHELTLYFTATTEHLMLKLMSWDGKEEFSARVRLPELTKNEKDEGGNYTYMKRYLLMNTFLVLADAYDPEDLPDNETNNANSANNTKKSVKKQENKSAETVNVDIPKSFNDAIDILHKKGIEDTEIKHDAIRKQIFKNGNFNKAEKDAIAAYCKNNWRPSK